MTLDWDRDGRDWPHREASRLVQAAGTTWHVQRMGRGPTLLLVHGTGSSTHSWRGLMPILAARHDVVALDLPGHGFSQPLLGSGGLAGFAAALAALLDAIEAAPTLGVGHSAGAAILVRMSLDGLFRPRGIVGLNPALLPFRGVAAHVLGPLARLLAFNPFVPRMVSASLDRRGAERMIRNTGSTIDSAGVDLYARLVADPDHVAGALAMMAGWDLDALAAALPRLAPPLHQIVGGNDRAVPPDQAERVRDILPSATVSYVRGLGHLAHEEAPDRIAALVEAFANQVGASAR